MRKKDHVAVAKVKTAEVKPDKSDGRIWNDTGARHFSLAEWRKMEPPIQRKSI